MQRLFIFSGFVYFSGMYWFVIIKLTIFSRFFLIKWADRGLVRDGIVNTDLFNVRFLFFSSFYIYFHQILFWIHNIFMIIFTSANFPFSFKLLANYPFNSIKGRVCSGYGIHHSQATHKEMSGHMSFFFGAVLYRIHIYYMNIKTNQFLKDFSPKGSGAMLNGRFRYFFYLRPYQCLSIKLYLSGATLSDLKKLNGWQSYCLLRV